jgi:spermidine synthase
MLGEVATIGLGAGSLACHRQEDEQWTFFEIDPEVIRIARDPKLFRYLSACAPTAPIVLGDGRLTLAATSGRYNLIVLDAFSSDAIPVHLLTREAFASYLLRLAPHGVIVAHVSNRHLELVSVVGAVASAERLVAYVKYDRPPFDPDHPIRAPGEVVALARASADLGNLPARKGWHPAVNHPDVAAWTDDYSNVLGALIRKKMSILTHWKCAEFAASCFQFPPGL